MSKPRWGESFCRFSTEEVKRCVKRIEEFYSKNPTGTKSTGFVNNKKGERVYYSAEEYKECVAMYLLKRL